MLVDISDPGEESLVQLDFIRMGAHHRSDDVGSLGHLVVEGHRLDIFEHCIYFRKQFARAVESQDGIVETGDFLAGHDGCNLCIVGFYSLLDCRHVVSCLYLLERGNAEGSVPLLEERILLYTGAETHCCDSHNQ